MTEWPEALVERVAEAIWRSTEYTGYPISEIETAWFEEDERICKALARAALDASGLREVVEAASAFEDDLSEYCDGPKRDRLRTILARIKGVPHA